MHRNWSASGGKQASIAASHAKIKELEAREEGEGSEPIKNQSERPSTTPNDRRAIHAGT